MWKSDHPVAAYVGSASLGLGFYHPEVPSVESTQWLNLTNCGVVKVKTGQISLAELEQELSEIYCKEWPWHIRELEEGMFLVRFPPHKKVSDIKNYPSFNLRKDGVQVEVLEWIGDLKPYGELQEVWVQLRVYLLGGVIGRSLPKLLRDLVYWLMWIGQLCLKHSMRL